MIPLFVELVMTNLEMFVAHPATINFLHLMFYILYKLWQSR